MFCVKRKIDHENEVIWAETSYQHNLDPKLFFPSFVAEITVPRELERESLGSCLYPPKVSSDVKYYWDGKACIPDCSLALIPTKDNTL